MANFRPIYLSAAGIFTDVADTEGVDAGNQLFLTSASEPAVVFEVIDSVGALAFRIRADLNSRNNIFIGEDCGASITLGFKNVCVGGNGTGGSITIGTHNLLFGDKTGAALTEGIGNVCMGANAGEKLTTPSGNMLVGTNCGQSITVGANNLAAGVNALQNSIIGSQNIVFGTNAGRACDGDDNSFFGNSAGRGITLGDDNLCFGRFAGFNASQKVDVVNSMCFGHSTFTDADNQIVLGNSSTVETILKGDTAVRIRNATTAQTLEVYNTYTSATNFERGNFEWVSNELRIGTEKGGAGGTARAFAVQTDGTTRLTFGATGDMTVADGENFIFNTTTGTKLGTAVTQKMGKWGATPIVQPAGANQAALTDSTGGTPGFTVSAVSGTGDDAGINNALASIIRLLNQLRGDLVSTGEIKGAA